MWACRMPFESGRRGSLFFRYGVVATVAALMLTVPRAAVAASMPTVPDLTSAHARTVNRVSVGGEHVMSDDSAQYDRYRTPSHCNAAIDRIRRLSWRNLDTVSLDRRMTPLPVMVAAAKRCAARFSVDGVDSSELAAFALLSVVANQPEQARAVTARLMSHAWTSERRARELLTVIRYYASVLTVPKQDMMALVAALDKLGAPVASFRVQAYLTLIQRARIEHNVPWLDSLFTQAAVPFAQLSASDRRQRVDMLHNYYALDAYRSILTTDGDAALRVIQRGAMILGTMSPLHRDKLAALEPAYQMLGEPAPALQAEFWFNTGSGGQARPAPGTSPPRSRAGGRRCGIAPPWRCAVSRRTRSPPRCGAGGRSPPSPA